jgi:hypothetical protein
MLDARLITIVTNTTFAQALQALTAMNEDAEQAQFPTQALRDFEIIARQYVTLTIQFQRYTPPVPVSCSKLHAYYGNALSTMPAVVRELRRAIAQRDTGAAMMVGQIANGVVQRRFDAADRELQRVTAEHGIPKPYDLGASGGGGGLLTP